MGVSPGGPGPRVPSFELLTHPDFPTRARARSEAISLVLNDPGLTTSDKVEWLLSLFRVFEDQRRIEESQREADEFLKKQSEQET